MYVVEMEDASTSGLNVKIETESSDIESSTDTDSQNEDNDSNRSSEHLSDGNEGSQFSRIDVSSIRNYAEQCMTIDDLPDDVLSPLAEDITYKMRYILNDALVKTRLSGRTCVTPDDLSLTFEALSLPKMYGVTSQPEWSFLKKQGIFYFKDKQVNLVDLITTRTKFTVPEDSCISTIWQRNGKDIDKHRIYFIALIEGIMDADPEVRKYALKDLTSNVRIASFIDWFYCFVCVVLYDTGNPAYSNDLPNLVKLLQALETSPNCRQGVSTKFLRDIQSIALHQLMTNSKNLDLPTIRTICQVLELVARRNVLRCALFDKIHKLTKKIHQNHWQTEAILNLLCYLGPDAVRFLFMPHFKRYMAICSQFENNSTTLMLLYKMIYKEDFHTSSIYKQFYEILGDAITVFSIYPIIDDIKGKRNCLDDRDSIRLKLLKSRRFLNGSQFSNQIPHSRSHRKLSLKKVFDLSTKLKRSTNLTNSEFSKDSRQTSLYIVIGKTKLLSVFNTAQNRNRKYSVLCQSGVGNYLWYNI